MDVPFGIRGGMPLPGEGGAFDPEAQVLATADGHPRAVGYLSRLPERRWLPSGGTRSTRAC